MQPRTKALTLARAKPTLHGLKVITSYDVPPEYLWKVDAFIDPRSIERLERNYFGTIKPCWFCIADIDGQNVEIASNTSEPVSGLVTIENVIRQYKTPNHYGWTKPWPWLTFKEKHNG